MKKTLAVIADIHGNIPAFKAILADIKKKNIFDIIIAGDMITDCPDSDEVLDLVRESDWTVIKGNREQYYLDHRAGLNDHWTHARQMSAMMWTFDRLSRKNRKYIEKLEEQAVLQIQDLKLKVVHGSPDSLSELMYPLSRKERFREIMSELKEDILICGHSHEQWQAEYKNKTAFNPGAAGVHFNREQSAEYAVLTIEGNIPTVEHFYVPYSIGDLENRFRKSGLFEASPHWSQSILDSIRTGQNISLKMIDYALALMEEEGIKESLVIPDRIWDRAGEEFLKNPGRYFLPF